MFVMFGTNLKHGGQFLEIGGADGYTHSNTYALEKRLGWRGTLVEPHPSQYKILTASRPGNNLLNAAISPTGQEETLRLRLCGQLSALDGHEGDDVHRQARTASRELTSVSGISLTRLLAERHFDYFSLDVEGAELKILASVDWDAVRRPDIITVEHNFSEGVREKIVALLQGQGYQERFAAHDWLRRGDIWATLP
jgi:FkbM family methyltransferase